MKNVRFSGRPRVKVRCHGPPCSARAQPWTYWKSVLKVFAQSHSLPCMLFLGIGWSGWIVWINGGSLTILFRLLWFGQLVLSIDLFYQNGGHIEFIRFQGVLWDAQGALAYYLPALLGQKRTLIYISREKGDHYYIQTGATIFFSYYNFFLQKLKEKLAWKAHIPVNTDASISDRARAPWASHNTP